MTRINLLPWRELKRRQLDRQILRGSIAGWVLMGLVALYVHLHYTALINTQNNRNAYLQKRIQEIDAQIKEIRDLKKKRAALIARMEIIQQLQRDRTQIVHVFDELVRQLPEGIYLTTFKKRGRELTLEGVAQSNGRISLFMRKLDASPWFVNPRLEVINVAREAGQRVSRFSLRVKQGGGENGQNGKTAAGG